ncbi:MAG: FAD-binding oxidoreductase [Saprospiraceae bacterium]|nr:FAD-binding oxidoreductase [Saprospiraceae bacterium]MBP9211122.1 FAD-binding oxidoreductase [Saprospiraceae bacterium]
MDTAKTDYLIAGGGLAGLVLAVELQSRGLDFRIVDAPDLNGACNACAGVVNPVTGMRHVLSWKSDQLVEALLAFFQQWEFRTGKQYLRSVPVFTSLQSVFDENQWMLRSGDPVYQEYIGSTVFSGLFANCSLDDQRFGQVHRAFRLDVAPWLAHAKEWLKLQGCWIDDKFSAEDLIRTPNALEWKGIRIEKGIAFTEGIRVLDNPYFGWLPMNPLKGDALVISCPGLRLDAIVKSGFALVPIGGDHYWCGSSFVLGDRSEYPDPAFIVQLNKWLEEHLQSPFDVLEVKSGVRPASRDRRPILGPHPGDSRLLVFNGLGTKGVSLAPYCARTMGDYLTSGTPIPHSMSVGRFDRWLRPLPN